LLNLFFIFLTFAENPLI